MALNLQDLSPPACNLCEGSEEENLAAYFCKNDDQHLCQKHYDDHQKLNSTKNHQLVCLLNSRGQAIHCSHLVNQCLYCKDHKVLCCFHCKKNSHSKCQFVHNVDSYLSDNESLTVRCNDMLKRLDTKKKKIEVKSSHAQDKENIWVTEMNESLANLNRWKKELEEKITKKVDYVKTIMNKKREDIDNKLSGLQNQINDIEKDLPALQESNAGTTRLKRFECAYRMEEKLKECEKLLIKAPTCHIEFLKFEHDFEAKNYVSGTLQNFQQAVEKLNNVYSEIQKYLVPNNEDHLTEHSDASATPPANIRQSRRRRNDTDPKLNSEETETKDANVPNRHRAPNRHRSSSSSSDADLTRFSRSYEDYHHMVCQEERDTYPSIPIQSRCQMKVKTAEDDQSQQCCITGIALVAGGNFMIMADYENSSLKLFKCCGDFVHQMKFEEKPRDIAKVDEHNILVNFPMAKNIQEVTIETLDSNASEQAASRKHMRMDDLKIHTNAKCCGIAYHDNKIYAATQMPHQIMIIDRNGHILRIIKGAGLFDRATYIAVDPETSLIYISDPSHKCIFGINEDAQIKFQYPVEQPHGIACGTKGQLFVGDWETGVHLVNKDGSRLQDLKVEELSCAQKLTYHVERKILLVTAWQCDIVRTIYLQQN